MPDESAETPGSSIEQTIQSRPWPRFPSARRHYGPSPPMPGADLEPDGIRVGTLTIAGQIAAGTDFDPANIANRYWEVVHSDGCWQAEFRFTGE
jgi:hypothetical protein